MQKNRLHQGAVLFWRERIGPAGEPRCKKIHPVPQAVKQDGEQKRKYGL